MIIAVDYDYTYNADPLTFDRIIKIFLNEGHTVICVTGRSDDGILDIPVRESIGKLVPIVFAGNESKRSAAKKHGYDVNVWIDDMPGSIDK